MKKGYYSVFLFINVELSSENSFLLFSQMLTCRNKFPRMLFYHYFFNHYVHYVCSVSVLANNYISLIGKNNVTTQNFKNGLIYTGKIAISFCVFQLYLQNRPERGRKSHNDTIKTCATSNIKLPLLEIHEFRLVTLFLPMSDLLLLIIYIAIFVMEHHADRRRRFESIRTWPDVFFFNYVP